jgi:hypothetical protein
MDKGQGPQRSLSIFSFHAWSSRLFTPLSFSAMLCTWQDNSGRSVGGKTSIWAGLLNLAKNLQ